jgi:glycosyltransferase involved in cell wall biosynthesis
MRVLMVSSLWPPAVLGGAEVYAAQLAQRLRERGHEVGVVTQGIDGDDVVARVPARPYRLDEFASQPGWRRAAFHAHDLLNIGAARTLQEAIQRFRPHVVHSHSIHGMSALALRASGDDPIARVHTIHDYWLLCQRVSMTNRDGVSCVDQCRPCSAVTAVHRIELHDRVPHVVLCVSEATAREHTRLPEVYRRIRVLHLPDGGERVDHRDAPGPVITFGYLGQLAPHKGVLTLMDAFAQLPAGRARLRIAGRGSVQQRVAARADGTNIEYVGFVGAGAKEAFLESLDCLVVPSEWREPGALVVSEAKADLLPVIGARIGGIPEVVPASCAGLLFTPGDVADLARALNQFCKEPEGFAVAPRHGSGGWSAHVAAVEDAYRDAVNLAAGEAAISSAAAGPKT